MKISKLSYLTIVPLVATLSACDVDQTQEARLPDVEIKAEPGNLPKYEVVKTEDGKLPDVDVNAKGGQLPKYDVDMADVDVGSKTVEVKVPTVDVKMPKDDDDRANRDKS